MIEDLQRAEGCCGHGRATIAAVLVAVALAPAGFDVTTTTEQGETEVTVVVEGVGG